MHLIDPSWSEEDEVAISYSRKLSLEALENAGSGHTGATLSLMPVLYALYTRVLVHDPNSPEHPDRDRLILSCGHVSLAQYVQLHLSGYGISRQDLMAFRTLGSNTPGHPEYHTTPGIEVSSGPLGQGFGMAVGVALAQQIRAKEFDGRSAKTYVVLSDGDIQEGITHEAANLASYYQLENLIAVYDSNDITIDGKPCISSDYSPESIFRGMGWRVEVIERNESGEINSRELLEHLSQLSTCNRPTLFIMKSEIGWPAPNWGGSAKVHGNLLPPDELEATILALNLPTQDQTLLESRVKAHYKTQIDLIKVSLSEHKEKPSTGDGKGTLTELSFPMRVSTRKANSEIIECIRKSGTIIFGGSADLTESNSLSLSLQYDPKHASLLNQNLRFGVREHAMAAIINGLVTDTNLLAFCATYLVFSDYQRPAIRMAALMRLPAIYLWTHDSVAIGADGPTHQPIEQIASLRTIPNLNLIRPGSADELKFIWTRILSNRQTTGLVLSRQDLLNDPERQSASAKAARGAYVYYENFRDAVPELIVIATGSELELAYEAVSSNELSSYRIRLVSMPCQSWFREESPEYQEEVLPKEVQRRISIEAGTQIGWHEFTPLGRRVSIENYGASGSGNALMALFGFTKENIVKEILELIPSNEK
jgi:transketolase